MKKKIIAGVIILIGLIAAGWLLNPFGDKPLSLKDTALLSVVNRGPLKISVSAKGAFEPTAVTHIMVGNMTTPMGYYTNIREETGISVEELKIIKLVPEGSRVNKGDVLAQFDGAPLEEQIKQLEEDLAAQKDSFKQMEENLVLQKNQLEFSLKWDESAIQSAKKELDKYMEDNPLELRSRKVELEQSKLGLKKIRKELVNLYEQVDQGKISEDSPQVNAKKLELEQTRISVGIMEKEFELFSEYAVPQEIFKRQIDHEKAISTMEKNKREGAAENEQRQIEIKETQKDMEKSEKALKIATEWRDKMTARAPVGGLVLYGGRNELNSFETSPSQVKEGGLLMLGQPIMKIPSALDMKINLQLIEVEIKDVKKGLKAEIMPEAFPGLVLPGKVEKVAEMTSDSANYPVEVICQKPDERIKPKMTARVEIIIEELADVIYAPINAIFEKDKKTVSYVAMPNGSSQTREVKLGQSNDDFIVVVSGLNQGEKVYLYDPSVENK
ncbi:MAG: biotin/lipoyl-binding protein [Planctomycetota bacterium]